MEVKTQVEPMRSGNIDGSGDGGRAAATSDRGEAGGTEDHGRTGWKVEPIGAKRVEGRSAAEGREVCGTDGATTDQGGARETTEPNGVVRTMDPGGAEEGRSHGGADWSTSRGGVTGLAAGG
ncbi:hypothetical protein PO909_006932 [Leuciscus waleckii]